MKKSIFKILLTFGIFILISESSFSQFILSGEIRPRFEVRNGYKTLPDSVINYAAFVSQRSRLAAQYKADKYNMKISFQDVHVWGDEQLKADVPGIALFEAWVEIPLCDSLSIKIGKQEFLGINERFLNSSNWSQQGSTHNAVTLKYKRSGWQVDFAAAFNQSGENLFGTDYSSMPSNYKTLDFLSVSKKFGSNVKLSALGITDGYQKAGTKNTTYIRGTFGGIAEFRKENKFSASTSGFFQTGHVLISQTKVNEVAAYYMTGDASYTIAKKYTILLGFEYFSGNDETNPNLDRSYAFNNLYGSTHAFCGTIDYFTNIPRDTKGAGLIDTYLDLIGNINDKFTLRADFHYFMLQNNYLQIGNVIDKNLGLEADLSCKYDFNKDASLQIGVSAMRGEKSLEWMVGGNSNYYGTWGFAMLTFKPTFFKSEKK